MSRAGEKGGASASPDLNNIPDHIAIIMDGNGRWAKSRGLPRTAGHAAGAETFRRIARYCKTIGVRYLTVYAFSTENWKRPETEVQAIMDLLEKYLDEAIQKMEREGIRIKVLGNTEPLSERIKERIRKTEELSSHIEGCQANLCINYGGRDEIVRAFLECEKTLGEGETITEELLSRFMDTRDMPDPELIIRPGGELRLSNFLLWQSAYAELYFTDVLWPDFDERELDKAIAAYQGRQRRYGGV